MVANDLKGFDPQGGEQHFAVGRDGHGVDLIPGADLIDQFQRAVALVEPVLGNQAVTRTGDVGVGSGMDGKAETADDGSREEEGFTHSGSFYCY
ncbi:hypothetical protein [Pseudomonas sp. MYb118]|uniref:hypothetical protein n=1 Tax=Pseudomonas sp. MYb118 TaxID=1848720 RepID=UPI0034D01AB5